MASTCTLYEGDHVQFSWSKDGNLLKSAGRIHIVNTPASSTLTIHGVKSSDSGSYTCIGSNSVSEERVSAGLVVEGDFPKI